MLFLVIDNGSGEGGALTLANSAEHAINEAREVLGYNAEEPGDLRAVSMLTAHGSSRQTLAFWDAVAIEAMGRGYSVKSVEDELRSLQTLLDAAVVVHRNAVKRAVAVEVARCVDVLKHKIATAEAERAEYRYEDPGYDRADGAADALAEALATILV